MMPFKPTLYSIVAIFIWTFTAEGSIVPESYGKTGISAVTWKQELIKSYTVLLTSKKA